MKSKKLEWLELMSKTALKWNEFMLCNNEPW